MRTSRALFFAASLLVVAACLDPLFEDTSSPATPRYAVCCEGVTLDTCECSERSQTCVCTAPSSCEVAYRPCAARSCVPASASGGGIPACPPPGGQDAGNPIPMDAGTPPQDAGTPPGDAGTPVDAGTEAFGACCVAGRVSTCPCLDSECSQPPFFPCARGTCVSGSAQGACP